jgi:hypothetical protein
LTGARDALAAVGQKSRNLGIAGRICRLHLAQDVAPCCIQTSRVEIVTKSFCAKGFAMFDELCTSFVPEAGGMVGMSRQLEGSDLVDFRLRAAGSPCQAIATLLPLSGTLPFVGLAVIQIDQLMTTASGRAWC